jgi:hypothetical protein
MASVPGKSTKTLLANPFDVSISLLIPSLNFEGFTVLYDSLIRSCSNPDDVEMLLKIDNTKDIDDFYQLCEKSPFKFKILLYGQYNGRFSLHHFFNDLGSVASGKIIWMLNDDAEIVSQADWYKPLVETRDRDFKDNVYCVMIPYDNGKGTKQLIPTPAFTKEWYELCREVTRFPNYDRWLGELAKKLDRRIFLTEDQILVTMPQGSRVLSKDDRKSLFYPALERQIRKLSKKLQD